jgi:N-methylhydantoinase A
MGFRISVDTGGTFTDVVIADAHGIRAIGKALTTPERIFAGMRTAIEVAAQELGLSGKVLLSKTDMLIYGTTRATNAVVAVDRQDCVPDHAGFPRHSGAQGGWQKPLRPP